MPDPNKQGDAFDENEEGDTNTTQTQESTPSETLDEDEVDQELDNNWQERQSWDNQFEDKSEELSGDIEAGAETEANSIGGMIKEALGFGKEMKDAQDQIETTANTLRDMSANRKAYFESTFSDAEDRVSIDGERVEDEYGEFRSEFDLALSETLPMAWERGHLETIKRNNARFFSATGELDVAEEKAAEEAGDLWLYGESEAEDAKERAGTAIDNVLDEVNVEAQALELRDRKETYENVKEVVDTAIQNVQDANADPSMDDMTAAIEDAAEEYGLDVGADLDEQTVENAAELSQDYIDDLAEELGVQDQVVSSVTTDVQEFFDDDEVDPIQAARLLKTTVADAFGRQAERYDTAVETVEEVQGDLESTLDSYDDFVNLAEDLTNVSGIKESRASDLQEAGIETVFDLADASQRRLDRMTDSGNLHGGHAENLVDNARSYIETGLAHELGLESLREEMEETLPVDGEDGEMSIQYAIREQAEAAYESIDTVTRHVNGLVQNNLPAEDTLGMEFEVDGETYSASEYAESERREAYEEMGLDAVGLDGISFLEETKELELEYEE